MAAAQTLRHLLPEPAGSASEERLLASVPQMLENNAISLRCQTPFRVNLSSVIEVFSCLDRKSVV